MNNRTPDLPHITPSPSGTGESWNSCKLDSWPKYCKLNNGAFIDESHFSTDTAQKLWTALQLARDKNINKSITLDQASPGFTFEARYMIYGSSLQGMSDPELAEVGLALWLDFQIKYETWQADNYGPIGKKLSSFHAEDIPSTYLAYVSIVKGKDYKQIVNDFGGGSWSILNGSPDVANATMYFIVSGDSGLSYVPYPDELMINPTANDNYWAFKSSTPPFWSTFFK